MGHNFPAGHGQPPAGLPRSDLERVSECLSVLSDALEKMRAAACQKGPPRALAGNVVGMEFAAKHDQMLTSFIVAVGPFVKPLTLDIPTNSYSRGCAVWSAGGKSVV